MKLLNNEDDAGLEAAAKAVTYTLGVLGDLCDKGILEGGKFRLTEKGRADYAILKASGYKPTEEEMRDSLAVIQRHSSEDT